MEQSLQRNIVSQIAGDHGVLTTIGVDPAQRGPWSYLTGIPNQQTDMVGPPPQYLSVLAWAA